MSILKSPNNKISFLDLSIDSAAKVSKEIKSDELNILQAQTMNRVFFLSVTSKQNVKKASAKHTLTSSTLLGIELKFK